jgi:hypothetical protein
MSSLLKLPPWRSAALTKYAQLLRKPSKKQVTSLLVAVFLVLRLRQRLARYRASVMSSSAKRAPKVPGFTAITDQIFVREPDAEPAAEGETDTQAVPDRDQPDVVLIYGWGDGLPKHVAKYADGFRALFPRARQFLVLSPIAKAMFSSNEQRAEAMKPLVRAMFADAVAKQAPPPPTRVLAHTMSNTGAINYSGTLHAHNALFGGPLEHQLLVMDSTPGSTVMTVENLKRWSRAMALGTAPWFPWPFVVTQAIMGVLLVVNECVQRAVGRENAGAAARRAAADESFLRRDVRTLYLYSQEDDLIAYQDIEAHVAESRSRGWEADTVLFDGSGHVGHMRMHPVKYWDAMRQSWLKAVEAKSS